MARTLFDRALIAWETGNEDAFNKISEELREVSETAYRNLMKETKEAR